MTSVQDSQIEFDVNMTCDSCVNSIKKVLENVEGLELVNINLENKQVIVNTSLPSSEIQHLIESTGCQTVLKGYGSVKSENKTLSAAVAALSGPSEILGVIRFSQINDVTSVIDGEIDGLQPQGIYGLNVHEFGDVSQGLLSLGSQFNYPGNEKHVDLHSITADSQGTARFRLQLESLKVGDIIGRSVSVIEKKNTKNLEESIPLTLDGNLNERYAFGVIARSAGLFENPKRICLCSGTTIWEERKLQNYSKAKI